MATGAGNEELVYTDGVFDEKRSDLIGETVVDDHVSHRSSLPMDISTSETFKESVNPTASSRPHP